MKTTILSILTWLLFVTAGMSQDFITSWKTFSASNKSITIPTHPGSTYLYDIDWENDGIFDDLNVTGDITHTYPTHGNHTIAIRGLFPRFYSNNFADRTKLISVDQWGNNAWTSMERAFYGCIRLVSMASDTPDFSGVTSMNRMFERAIVFNDDISHWDVSTVTDFSRMFYRTETFNQPLSPWDVSSATNMSYMFYRSEAFNQDLIGWDVASVTNMNNMFEGGYPFEFNGDISTWDVSNVTTMHKMFYNCKKFNQDLAAWDVSHVDDMSDMFRYCDVFNQDLAAWDVSHVDVMGSMLGNSGMDVVNLDKTLIGWATQPVKSGIGLGTQNLAYCSSEAARNILTSPPNNWNIYGDTKICIPGTDCVNTQLITQLPFQITDSTTCGFFDNYQSGIACATGGISLLGEDIIWEYIPTSDQTVDIILNGPSGLYSTLIISADACFSDSANAVCIATLTIPNGGLDTLNSLILDENRHYYIGLSIRGTGVSCGTYDLTINELLNFSAGIDCNAPKLIQSLPFALNNWTTCGFVDNYPNNLECISGAATWPGEDMIWEYTPLTYENVDVIIDTEIGFNSTLLVSADACFHDTTNAECIATFTIPNGGLDSLKGLFLEANRTYYFGLSMHDGTDSCGFYDITINGMTTSSPEHFIMTWNAQGNITIPTRSNYTYDYDIDWESDGVFDDFNVTGDITHNYSNSDTVSITIRGVFPAIHFENHTKRNRLLSIDQWGNIQWKTMESAFESCSNLILNATDAPDLSQTTSLRKMFSGSWRVNSAMSHWDLSTITNTVFMFEDVFLFNQDISTWDVSNVTNMRGMFLDAAWFNQDIGNWDVSNVEDFNFLFDGASRFNKDISTWDVSSATSMSFAFRDASSFNQNLGDWDISNVTVMNEMLHDCGLSIANYDSTLIGWAAGSVKPGIVLDAEGLYYCNGAAARAQLIGSNSWSFLYDNQNCFVGVNCSTPIIIDSFPYQMNASTCGYVNNYTGASYCGSGNLNGEDIVWKYTPSTSRCVTFTVQGSAGRTAHLIVADRCAPGYVGCLVNMAFPGTATTVIPHIFLEANQDYYILFSMHGSSSCGNFNMEIIDSPPGTNVWVGPANDDWFASPDNWCLGHFPTSEENVLIPMGKTVNILSGELGEAFTIEVEQGGLLDVQIGGDLEVVTD